MADILSSPLWNLAYIAAAIFLLWRAYYSRHEQIQKLTLLWIGIMVISNVWLGNVGVYILLDVIGLSYCLSHLISHDERFEPPIPYPFLGYIAFLFTLMIFWSIYHAQSSGLRYQIGVNLLAMAQLTILCIYGKRYGLLAREHQEQRNDLYYRVWIWLSSTR